MIHVSRGAFLILAATFILIGVAAWKYNSAGLITLLIALSLGEIYSCFVEIGKLKRKKG